MALTLKKMIKMALTLQKNNQAGPNLEEDEDGARYGANLEEDQDGANLAKDEDVANLVRCRRSTWPNLAKDQDATNLEEDQARLAPTCLRKVVEDQSGRQLGNRSRCCQPLKEAHCRPVGLCRACQAQILTALSVPDRAYTSRLSGGRRSCFARWRPV